MYLVRGTITSSYSAIECLPLPPIDNGFIRYTPDVSPSYELDSMATYTCNAGFILDLSNGSETRTCVDDDGMDAVGVFNRQAPSCIRKLK